MRILVVGAGSIGRRHIKNMNSLGYADIDVVDVDEKNLEYARKNFKVKKTFGSIEEALAAGKYDVGFVLTPPAHHIPLALKLAGQGADLFIEKPLSHNLDGVEELMEVEKKKGIVVMVGYNQRFNLGVAKLRSCLEEGALGKIYYVRAEVGQYLPDWRPQRDYRQNYTAIKELGGGILLDASHELDYVLWLVGGKIKEVKAIHLKASDLEVDVEDLAEVMLRFDDDVVASVHLNMVERGYNRCCKIVGELGSVKWVFKDGEFEFFDGVSGELKKEKFEVDPNHSYVEELKHFFSCVETRKRPLSNLETAKATLELVLKIKEGGA